MVGRGLASILNVHGVGEAKHLQGHIKMGRAPSGPCVVWWRQGPACLTWHSMLHMAQHAGRLTEDTRPSSS